jgi:hemolysin D
MLTGTDEPNERVRGTELTTSEPAGQEMVYAARISLDRAQMQVEDKLVTLTPAWR